MTSPKTHLALALAAAAALATLATSLPRPAFAEDGAATTPEAAGADAGAFPRFSVGFIGGVAIPVLFETGDAGGYLDGNVGVRFNDYVQWDILDVGGIVTWQSELFCDPACSTFEYRADALFIGTALRLGYFKKSAPVNPYLIAGLGAGRINYDFPGISTWDWGFSGNIGVGVEMPIGPHFTAGVVYRFYAQRDDLFQETAKVNAVGVEVGWR